MNQYKAILKDNIRQVFDDYTCSLNVPEISYFAIGIQNTINKSSASVMTSVEWQALFKTLDFAAHDPIRKASLYTQRNLIFFDEVDHCDTLGREIMLQRKKFEMSNGLVIMERHLTYNYMLTLATNYSRFNGRNFYLKFHEDIHRIFGDLKLILNPIARNYKTNYEAFISH